MTSPIPHSQLVKKPAQSPGLLTVSTIIRFFLLSFHLYREYISNLTPHFMNQYVPTQDYQTIGGDNIKQLLSLSVLLAATHLYLEKVLRLTLNVFGVHSVSSLVPGLESLMKGRLNFCRIFRNCALGSHPSPR